jgi:hypothetical protein
MKEAANRGGAVGAFAKDASMLGIAGVLAMGRRARNAGD